MKAATEAYSHWGGWAEYKAAAAKVVPDFEPKSEQRCHFACGERKVAHKRSFFHWWWKLYDSMRGRKRKQNEMCFSQDEQRDYELLFCAWRSISPSGSVWRQYELIANFFAEMSDACIGGFSAAAGNDVAGDTDVDWALQVLIESIED